MIIHLPSVIVVEFSWKKPQKTEEKEKQIVHLSGRKRRDWKYKPDGMNCEVYFLVLTEQIYVQSMWLGGQKYRVVV